MLRRHLLTIVCLALSGALALACTFVTLNFVRLAEAQSFVQDFVREAVDEGSAMPLPAVAPAASAMLSHDAMIRILDRARRIGPLVEVDPASCTVQADAANMCGGQLMACIVTGTGHEGAFEADIALCRGGDIAAYRLAVSHWRFDFTNGEPADDEPDRSHV